MNNKIPATPVFPSRSDTELWQKTLDFLHKKYPGRVMEEHARQAFESVCAELDSSSSVDLKNFLRRVATKWMWERPALPRGVSGMEGWREIRPSNLPDDWDKD